jgi:hypothetical protein
MATDRLLGVTDEVRIEQRGETIKSVQTRFELIDNFKNLRLA